MERIRVHIAKQLPVNEERTNTGAMIDVPFRNIDNIDLVEYEDIDDDTIIVSIVGTRNHPSIWDELPYHVYDDNVFLYCNFAEVVPDYDISLEGHAPHSHLLKDYYNRLWIYAKNNPNTYVVNATVEDRELILGFNFYFHLLGNQNSEYKDYARTGIKSYKRKHKSYIALGTIDYRKYKKQVYDLMVRDNIFEWDGISYSILRADVLVPQRNNENHSNFHISDTHSIPRGTIDIALSPHELYDTYLTLVVESRPEVRALTEKIVKPMINGMPYVWVAFQGLADWLVDNGFKLYPFIDYSFDKIEDIEKRIETAYNEFKRLHGTIDETTLMKYSDIIEHNRQHVIDYAKTIETEFVNKLKYLRDNKV